MNLHVNPILPLKERNQEERPAMQKRKLTPSKILGVVLRVTLPLKGGLLLSANIPQTVMDLLSSLSSVKQRNGDWIRTKLDFVH